MGNNAKYENIKSILHLQECINYMYTCVRVIKWNDLNSAYRVPGFSDYLSARVTSSRNNYNSTVDASEVMYLLFN